jgi:biotin synthase
MAVMVESEFQSIDRIGQDILDGREASAEDASRLMALEDPAAIRWLLSWGGRIRDRFRGGAIDLCAIVNAKSGRCSEDCAFCAQSARYTTGAEVFPLLDTTDILDARQRAAEAGALRFSLVISGRGPVDGPELDRLMDTIQALAAAGPTLTCASLGLIDEAAARRLAKAGLRRYHHNLEAGPSFFPNICTTHVYEDRVQTIRAAQSAGLEVCSGGIIGLGETAAQRLELGLELRRLGVESVAVNILNPIPGTPLENVAPLPALEVLKTIAVFRLIMPAVEIRTCGGRERALNGLQPMMFVAGASGTMTGDYLTTAGRDSGADRRDTLDLGLSLRGL